MCKTENNLKEYTVGQKFTNEASAFWFEGNILASEYNVTDIDLEVARSGVQLRHSIVKGESFPLFVDISNVKSISKEARDYLSRPEATMYVKAAAILAGSYLSKIVGSFFLSFNKPPVPTKLFTNRADAFKWLERFVGGEVHDAKTNS